jgi:hypothetical protein
MIYVHDPAVGHWPTLRTLIETNKVSRRNDSILVQAQIENFGCVLLTL